MLRNLRIREEYFTGEVNLVDSFYKPCLAASTQYDRSVGFFRSSVFLLIGPDVIEFVKRGGRIRLICSPELTEEDIIAMKEGYDSQLKRVTRALLQEVELLFSSREIAKNTEALATLITLGALDVRLAFSPESIGEYHTKLGIFRDNTDDSIVFKGSINETWRGWHERGNHETLDVFCDWHQGSDKRRANRNRIYFEELWNGQNENLEILSFPDVAFEKLKSVAKASLEDIDSNKVIDFFHLGHTKINAQKTNDSRFFRTNRSPLKHQTNAIKEWKRQGKRGILEHATGSGKTFTAITALKEHLEPEGLSIVLVPSRLLHSQWAEELNNEIEGVRLLKAGAGHNKWKDGRRLSDFTSPLGGLGKRVVLATMQTARTDIFRKGINQDQKIMVIADEVHEIGSHENSKALDIASGPRLGLSATPKRYGDSEGTTKILNYFGPIVQPPYTLQDAICDKRLVPYEYFPKAIHLSADESEQWTEKTNEISREYARLRRNKDGDVVISSYFKNLLIQRSRIAKRAKAKVPLAVSIIKTYYQADESWLIYCEDQSQLERVMETLKEEGISPLEYHTNMKGNSEATLDYFKNFGGILCAINCLDQGVDIPKISHAIILASSQNPRQFIQRRGRVLRVCSGKYKAVIFDAIVVPVSLELEPEQLSLLKSEFQRSLQFAKTSLNKSAANKLINLAIELGIDPQEVGLFDSDGIEED